MSALLLLYRPFEDVATASIRNIATTAETALEFPPI